MIANNGWDGASNDWDGVSITSSAGHTISNNAIYANAGLGIEIGNDGVTPNDTPDTDGAQNFPVLTAAVTTGAQVTISGTLSSTPGATFRLEFFASPAPGDASGYGEGERFLGAVQAIDGGANDLDLTVDGVVTFSVMLTPVGGVAVNERISATATDLGTGDTSEFSAHIAATLPNTAPVANNVGVPGNEDDPSIAITLAGTDAEGPIASFRIVGPLPANGLLYTDAGLTMLAAANTDYTAAGGTMTLYFVPAANWSGVTGFQFTATDAGGLTSPAAGNATINVAAVNDAPVAIVESYNVTEDFELSVPIAAGVLANDTDIDSAPLSAVLDAGAANGSLTLNADGSFTYTPSADFTGVDTFTYHAFDGSLSSAATTVSITVDPANDPPVATDDLYLATEDTPLVVSPAAGVLTNDTDVDGPAVSVSLVAGPANGVLALNGDGSFTYTPNANFNGVDSFTYQATDGLLPSGVATVTINVGAVNDSPVAVADAAATNENVAVTTGDVLLNDSLGDQPATIFAFDGSSAQGGAVAVGAGNTFVYTPAAAFSGTDTFTYTIRDSDGETSTATVTVTVANVANDPPVNIVPGAQISAEDVALVFSTANGNRIAVSDPDAGANPLEVTLAATNGVLTLLGTTGLTFTVGTGTGDATMTFMGTMADINVALNGMRFLPPLNFTSPPSASVTITTRDQGATGLGVPLSDTDTVNIAVNAVDDAPTLDLDADDSSGATGADYQRSYTEQGGPRLIIDSTDAVLADTDSADLASLTVTITNLLDGAAESLSADTTGTLITASYNTATGVLTLNGADTIANYQQVLRTVRYDNTSETPNTTARVITFVASDGGSASNVGTATVTVIAVNDDPVATITAASYTATENVALDLHGTGMAVSDIDALTTSVVTVYLDSISGLLSATAGTTGVTVAGSGSPSLTLTGTLAQVNSLLAGGGGGTITYLVGSDSPAPTDTLSLAINDMGATGTGGARWGWDSVTVNLIAVNDAPLITIPGTATTAEDTPLVFSAAAGNQISITDVDAAGTSVEVALSVTNGTLSLAGTVGLTFTAGANGTGAMTFTGTVAAINAALDGLAFAPTADYSGPAFLSLTVNDLGASGLGGALMDSDFASITVTPSNDAPDGADATVTTPQDTPYVLRCRELRFHRRRRGRHARGGANRRAAGRRLAHAVRRRGQRRSGDRGGRHRRRQPRLHAGPRRHGRAVRELRVQRAGLRRCVRREPEHAHRERCDAGEQRAERDERRGDDAVSTDYVFTPRRLRLQRPRRGRRIRRAANRHVALAARRHALLRRPAAVLDPRGTVVSAGRRHHQREPLLPAGAAPRRQHELRLQRPRHQRPGLRRRAQQDDGERRRADQRPGERRAGRGDRQRGHRHRDRRHRGERPERRPRERAARRRERDARCHRRRLPRSWPARERRADTIGTQPRHQRRARHASSTWEARTSPAPTR